MRTFDSENGKKIIRAVYNNQCIKPTRLQGIVGMYSKTFNSWIERLINFDILANHEGFIQLTENAKVQYEKGSPVIPIDHRRKSNTITKVEKKGIALDNKVRKEKEEEKERCENVYLEIVTIAACDSIRFKRTSNVKAGEIPQYNIDQEKHVAFTSYSLPGVGISDLVSKQRRRTDYLINRRRNVGNAELFAYIQLTEGEAEEHIKALQNHNPPILEVIDFEPNGKPRYGIIDPILWKFIKCCVSTLSMVNMRMQAVWLYERWMNHDEKEWYNRLYGKQGKGTRVLQYYVGLKNEREEFRKKDKKTQSVLKNCAEYNIAYYDKWIKDSYYNTIMSEKYSYIRKQYRIIAEPLIKVIYPEFLRKIHEDQNRKRTLSNIISY